MNQYVKTIYLLAGLTALAVLGLLVAGDATDDGGKLGLQAFKGKGFMMGGHRGMGPGANLGELGLSENATRQEIHKAMWEKRLADLGLTESSTIGEFRQAMQTQRQAMQAQMQEKYTEMLGKLGLDSDATPDQIREAHKAYCEENPDDCPTKLGFRGGFGRGMRKPCGG